MRSDRAPHATPAPGDFGAGCTPKVSEIRGMSEVHLDGASELVRDLRTDMNGKQVCTAAEMRVVLEASLTRDDYQGFVAVNPGGRALGYLGLNRRFAIYAGGVFFQITELFVASSARREGVASRLIGAAEDQARSEGGTCLELGAPSERSHPGTHAFYESRGFRIVGPRLSKALAPS